MERDAGDAGPESVRVVSKLRVRRTNIRKVRKRKSRFPWLTIGLITVLTATGLALLFFAMLY